MDSNSRKEALEVKKTVMHMIETVELKAAEEDAAEAAERERVARAEERKRKDTQQRTGRIGKGRKTKTGGRVKEGESPKMMKENMGGAPLGHQQRDQPRTKEKEKVGGGMKEGAE